MASLKGTKTHENLKAAFAGESQANRRYLYFAKVADVEGQPEIAGLFRDTAEGETGHAHGHLDYLKSVGDPATGLPLGDSLLNLKAAVHGETHEYTDMYPGMAKTARDEGFAEIHDCHADAMSAVFSREAFRCRQESASQLLFLKVGANGQETQIPDAIRFRLQPNRP